VSIFVPFREWAERMFEAKYLRAQGSKPAPFQKPTTDPASQLYFGASNGVVEELYTTQARLAGLVKYADREEIWLKNTSSSRVTKQ
jgi:hypothetical protein